VHRITIDVVTRLGDSPPRSACARKLFKQGLLAMARMLEVCPKLNRKVAVIEIEDFVIDRTDRVASCVSRNPERLTE